MNDRKGRSITKRVILVILGLLVLAGVLGGIKGLQIEKMIAQGKQFVPPPAPVTSAVVGSGIWESLLTAIGSLEAVQGVVVTAELTGKVVHIGFDPGAMVKAGDLLVQQDTAAEEAQLRAAEANVALRKINLERMGKLLAAKTVSEAENDNADAQFKEAEAQADNIRAIIRKKTIRAPFAGRLGIRLINLGQILNEGQPIVSLQSIDPIYVNFLLPQQQLAQVSPDLTVRVTTDALPGHVIEGKITAINSEVDSATRNIRIQGTLSNTQGRLRPGMFVNVAVVLPVQKKVLTIPATSVLYAPYGDSVFVIEEMKDGSRGHPQMVVRQQFVRLGDKRGDFINVISGLKPGETVVSTGVFKLRNGQTVVVDNSLSPEFKLKPKLENH